MNEYNSTCHNTIKIIDVLTSTDVKSSTYIDSSKEINDKDPKSKIGEIFRISKYKNIFVKGYTKNWSKEVFWLKNSITVSWSYVISGLNSEEIVRTFSEKEWKKQREFRTENY